MRSSVRARLAPPCFQSLRTHPNRQSVPFCSNNNFRLAGKTASIVLSGSASQALRGVGFPPPSARLGCYIRGAVSRVDVAHMLSAAVPQPRRLTAPSVPTPPKPAPIRTCVKPIPYQRPLTAAECQDRREMLKQAIDAALRQRAAQHTDCNTSQTAQGDTPALGTPAQADGTARA
jgi:hypothetical protein